MAAPRELTDTVDIKIRMREPLRAQIERAAKERAVSMNAEMIDRLEHSFSEAALSRSILVDALDLRYGEKLSALLQILAAAIEAAGTYGDAVTRYGPQSGPWRNDWMANPYAFSRSRLAADTVMGRLAPAGEIQPPLPISEEEKAGWIWGLSARQHLLESPWEEALLAALGPDNKNARPEVRHLLEPLLSKLRSETFSKENRTKFDAAIKKHTGRETKPDRMKKPGKPK